MAAEAEKELQRVSAEAALKQKQQELELKKVELELARIQEERRVTDQLASRRAKVPKLPTSIAEKDELDQPFQRQNSRGQGQECSRPRTKDTAASVLQKKGLQKKFFRQSPVYRPCRNF